MNAYSCSGCAKQKDKKGQYLLLKKNMERNLQLHIDIYSLRFPDLQIVDLPGLTKTPVVGQNEKLRS